MPTAEYRSYGQTVPYGTAKPTRKGKGTSLNSSPPSFFNQSIISIHITLIPLDLIGHLSILDYTNIAYADK